MFTTKKSIDDLSIELNGITQSLYLLAKEFDNIDRPAALSNEMVSGSLFQIASHIERITNDLDDIEKGK